MRRCHLPGLTEGLAGARRHRLHRRIRSVVVVDQDSRSGHRLGYTNGASSTHCRIAASDIVILSAEQRDLASSVRALLAKHANVRRAMVSDSGYDADLWRRLCDQIGIAALAIPEEFDGIGAGAVESHVVLEELGKLLVPTPMLGSVVLAAQALLAIGDTDTNSRLLPGIADGTSIAALCWAGASGWDEIGVSFDGDTLTGAAHYVLDGSAADVLIVVAHHGNDVAFFEIDPATVTRREVRTMDPTRRFAVVEFDAVTGRRLPTEDAAAVLNRVRTIACAALAAEQVGAADRCLAMTVEYTKSRVQFGRPIGSFQALKHRMADMFALVETARSASYAATNSLAADDAAVAKVYCSEAFSQVAAESIQLHGGIAITWEHDAQLYFKRAHGSAQLFGSPETYIRRFAQLA
ncbi:acyl-CoA dehydrogenase [Antrihabitans cavernicola]|uniref:Acyl-CoA dehydrogenase n=1 Tax=Antrihabitans cavernicola TaxID=2495913 RepID=A0A5A7SAU0_9NOCA|nr:acyl-CoA dehydrogenase [Spelaeibacter cavernicola]